MVFAASVLSSAARTTKMKTGEFKIRSAGFADVPAIFGLIKDYPDQLLPRPISDIAQNIDRFLVAVSGRRVVGAVSWQILPEIGVPKHPCVEVKSLAVRQDHQHRGIGMALALEAIERVKPLRPEKIVALTFCPDFFRKIGFKETPKGDLMHKIYSGCIACAKYDSPFTCPEAAMCFVCDTAENNNDS